MGLRSSLSADRLGEYTRAQLNVFFPDDAPVGAGDLQAAIEGVFPRLENCFKHLRSERYCDAGGARFNHLYSDQYLMYLWMLSNELWIRQADPALYNKVYLLNKCLHAFDCAWDTPLPSIFVIVHGVGTVLGKGEYSDFLVVYQGCTVGQTKGHYPRIGRGVGLGAGASVIGSCEVGDHASIGVGCALVNASVPANTTTFRDDEGCLVQREGRAAIAGQYFREEFLFS